MKLLQIDFYTPGPFGAEMSEKLIGLAESIAREPGLIWKIWTENADTGEAGGIYCFEDEANLMAYWRMHEVRIKEAGITNPRVRIFDVNVPLSRIDRAPGV